MNKFLNVMGMIRPVLEAADVMEELGDTLLDCVEEFVKRTDNKVDDAVIAPAIAGFRLIAGIADNDKKDEKNLEVVK